MVNQSIGTKWFYDQFSFPSATVEYRSSRHNGHGEQFNAVYLPPDVEAGVKPKENQLRESFTRLRIYGDVKFDPEEMFGTGSGLPGHLCVKRSE